MRLAVAALWLRVLSIAALAVYTVVQGGQAFWLPLIDFVASAALVALWAPLVARTLQSRPVRLTDPRRRAVALAYPWLIAYEAAIWLLSLGLPALVGMYPEVNPVALAVQTTVAGAGIATGFLVYLLSLRLMSNPADATGRHQLADLFNLAAALAAASVVFSVVPMRGMPAPSAADQWAYALVNAAELLSWLLLRWALVRAPETD